MELLSYPDGWETTVDHTHSAVPRAQLDPIPLPRECADEIIKPIETHYAGCRFRSRLEARWAVFFDQLGISWDYEPEGFVVAGKPYLPDFWLPELDIWAEVKGVLDASTLDHLAAAADPASGLPASPVANRWRPTLRTGRILVLGQVPRPTTSGWLHCRIDFIHGEPAMREVAFLGGARSFALVSLGDPYPAGFDPGTDVATIATGRQGPIMLGGTVREAYEAARKARFEHGESGYPKPSLPRKPPKKATKKLDPRARSPRTAAPPIEHQAPDPAPASGDDLSVGISLLSKAPKRPTR